MLRDDAHEKRPDKNVFMLNKLAVPWRYICIKYALRSQFYLTKFLFI